MAERNKSKAPKTPIEKSHSRASNAKLTLLCILSSLSLFCAVISLAFIKIYSFMPAVLTVSGVIFLLTIVLLAKFKR